MNRPFPTYRQALCAALAMSVVALAGSGASALATGIKLKWGGTMTQHITVGPGRCGPDALSTVTATGKGTIGTFGPSINTSTVCRDPSDRTYVAGRLLSVYPDGSTLFGTFKGTADANQPIVRSTGTWIITGGTKRFRTAHGSGTFTSVEDTNILIIKTRLRGVLSGVSRSG